MGYLLASKISEKRAHVLLDGKTRRSVLLVRPLTVGFKFSVNLICLPLTFSFISLSLSPHVNEKFKDDLKVKRVEFGCNLPRYMYGEEIVRTAVYNTFTFTRKQ